MMPRISLGRRLARLWSRFIVQLTPLALVVIVLVLYAGGILVWRAFNEWAPAGGKPPVTAAEAVTAEAAEAERLRLISRIEPRIPLRYQTTIEKTTSLTLDEQSITSDQISVCKVAEASTACKVLEYGEESYQQHIGPDLEYWLNVVHSRRRSHYWLHLRQKTTEVEGEVSWAGNYAIDPGEAFIFSLGPDQTIRVARGAQ